MLRSAVTNLMLPPLILLVLTLAGGLWSTLSKGRRAGGLVAVACAASLLFLSTPLCAGLLTVALERCLLPSEASVTDAGAIIVLGAEMANSVTGPDIGPLTLERLRAGAAVHRRTDLPILVTGGPLAPGAPPIAEMMAASLATDFHVPARWVEPRARDTRENAMLSAAMLRQSGIHSAVVVSHGWHLLRARAAFARQGFSVTVHPVRLDQRPDGSLAQWLPRPDHLTQSWYVLREMAGLLLYRMRDGH